MICLLVDMSSCLPTAVGLAVHEQRNENGRFLFSPVHYPIQQGLTYLFRSVCADTESEGGYRFKVVNLHAVFVRYADSLSYFALPQNSAFAECLYLCPKCRGGYPEQIAEFTLSHGGCAYVGRHGNFAVLFYRDYIPFSFHRCSVLRLLLNGAANVFLHIRQLVRQGFHILTDFLVGDFGVYLRGFDISVSQKTADGFNRYTVG